MKAIFERIDSNLMGDDIVVTNARFVETHAHSYHVGTCPDERGISLTMRIPRGDYICRTVIEDEEV